MGCECKCVYSPCIFYSNQQHEAQPSTAQLEETTMQRIQGKVIIIQTKSCCCRYFSIIMLCLFILTKMMKSPALKVSQRRHSVNDGVVTSRGGKRDSRGNCFSDDLPKNVTTSRYGDSRGRYLGDGSNYLKAGVYFGLSGPHVAS